MAHQDEPVASGAGRGLAAPDGPLSGAPPGADVLSPVQERQRIRSIDVLRGVAVLGILPMNIPFFALSNFGFVNPSITGGFEGRNFWTWYLGHLVFELKMMAIFSMLFGAGLVLISDRAAAKGRSPAGIYYRRVMWLLLIGLIHAYGFWWGDILVIYALCGFLLYPLRRIPARWLVLIGIVVNLTAVPVQFGQGAWFEFMRDQAALADGAVARGEEPTEFQQGMKEGWEDIAKDFVGTPEALEEERKRYVEGGWDLFVSRAKENVFFQTFGFFFFGLWRPGGMMILGMGLMKLGIFSAARSNRFYGIGAVLGYVIGLPIVWLGAERNPAHAFDMIYMFKEGFHYNYIGSMFAAFAHVCVVMLICKNGALPRTSGLLADVGRMPLTNYLMQTLICTTVFYGYGLALWGRFDRFELLAFVLGIWVLLVLLSRWWMARFRFGPAEWLWRSLSYWSLQPMRHAAPAPMAG